MSIKRNVVSHITVMHGVEFQGSEGEWHSENMRVEFDICNKLVCRHVNLYHPTDAALSQFTKTNLNYNLFETVILLKFVK